MRLTAIKLAGFKSFVDATTFTAPTNLTGIVGPNGCGKSNIIDAVRWVMGEGSAKVLRGESMADVIFSGSSSRKPVGTAGVELVFDNTSGRIAGEFANYNEISVKRLVGRDGVSQYTLNGTRCRRKDVRDLFLGTGLGSKSYSIIEQGMISQVVDAGPDEVRSHLEEAAGISRYKERRRETERRIKHTRENLDRLADLREEIGNHLSRLKRQANAAERYRKLKIEQRELESNLLALQWSSLQKDAEIGRSGLAVRETAMQEQVAEQRAAEARMETIHQQQANAGEALNVVQGEVYSIGSDIARLEQTIQHSRELQARQKKDFDETSASLQDMEQHMVLDRAQVEDLTTRLAEVEPALENAQRQETSADAEMQAAETEVADWQENLEAHHVKNNELNRKADSLRATVEMLDGRMQETSNRLKNLAGETEGTDTGSLSLEVVELEKQGEVAARQLAGQQKQLEQNREELESQRQGLRDTTARQHELQGEINRREGRLESLKALQQAAHEGDGGLAWLESNGLKSAPRLVEQLKVEKGWEAATETVLGFWLDSVLVDDPSALSTALGQLTADGGGIDLTLLKNGTVIPSKNGTVIPSKNGTVIPSKNGTVIPAKAGTSKSSHNTRPLNGTLAEKVTAPPTIIAQLNQVFIADSLESAFKAVEGKQDGFSVITAEGQWIGPGWVRVAGNQSGQSGMLARKQEIESLQAQAGKLQQQWSDLSESNQAGRENLPATEKAINQLQQQVNDLHRKSADLDSRLHAGRARIEDLSGRQKQIAEESANLQKQQKNDQAQIKSSRTDLAVLLDDMAVTEKERFALDAQRRSLLERRDRARTAAREARNLRHELALKTESRRASLDSLRNSLERMDTQFSQLQQRYLDLSEQIAQNEDPQEKHRAEMDSLLQTRLEAEQRLTAARVRLQELEEDYRKLDAARQTCLRQVEEIRQALERARLQQQEVELNARNLLRQVEQLGHEVAELAAALPEDADAQTWQENLERLEVRITRLEPVNLAAISEYEQELKRKEYMDAQHEDLIDALETLENAIKKIDRKTRTRFKDTFESVNKGLQELFPVLFGGGHAYLELTGDDLLTTGVSIMARPPGKRISSIHLMSGGEKALTAVAFVFAIFRLNPAPFCLLDEVDAPLDDANVSRFTTMVKEMSESVQFIVVTHNKITMEMVHQLSGVTMREPGVSRLVQVDIDEAVKFTGD